MNDVRLHVPYIFGNKQNSKKRERKQHTQGRDTEEKQKGERPAVGQEK